MIQIDTEEKRGIWTEIEKEFPDDRVMQEIHYARRLRYEQVKDLPLEERFRALIPQKERAA
jgi:hypothetical protein